MDKSITTLVPDIYKVLSNGTNIKEDSLKKLTDNLSALMVRRLSPQKEQRNYLSMSNFGSKCRRQLWYKVNKPELAEALDPWAVFKFLYGDVLEELFLFLAREAGHKVEGQQDEVEIHGLKGHRDAVIDGVLVDVKSANSRGFVKFREHLLESDDPFGYLDQLSLYLAACKKDDTVKVKGEAVFAAVDKEMGHLVLDTYKMDTNRDWEKEISSTRAMLAEKFPPNREYFPVAEGKSGNMRLDTACSYCPFKNECWKDSNQGKGLVKYFYSRGPVWLTKVVKEPKVQSSFDEDAVWIGSLKE